MASTVTVNIVGDAGDLQRALGQAGSQLDKFGDRATSIGRSMSIGVTLPIIAMGKAAFTAASDLAESMSKADTIFGTNAGKIRAWADTASTAFGQSKQSALENAASFGNMFQQLDIGGESAAKMSMKMVELASDFASFHNADITEVLEAQSAAFRGEYDAIQRFVPTINAAAVQTRAMADSGKDNASALTDQEKAIAAYELIIEGAGAATGDFARTSDGAANSLRTANAEITDAAAAIGSKLLPIVATTAGVIAELVSAFSELPDGVQTAVLAAASLVAAYGPVAYVFGAVAKGVSGLIDVASAVGSVLATVGSTIGQAFLLISGGLATAEVSAAAVVTAVAAVVVAIVGMAAAIGYPLHLLLGSSFDPLLEAIDKARTKGNNWAETIIAGANNSRAPLDEMRSKIDALRASREGLRAQVDAGKISEEQAIAMAVKYNTAIDGVKKGIGDYKQAQAEARAADEARYQQLVAVANGTMQVAAMSKEAQQAIQDMSNAQLAAAGGALGLEAANMNLTKAQETLDAAIRDHGPASREAAEADLALRQARLQVASASDKAFASERDLIAKVSEGPAAVDSMIQAIRDEIAANGDASGVLAERIGALQFLNQVINGVPATHATDMQINAFEAIARIAEIQGAIDRIPRDVGVSVRIQAVADAAGVYGMIGSDRNIKHDITPVRWN